MTNRCGVAPSAFPWPPPPDTVAQQWNKSDASVTTTTTNRGAFGLSAIAVPLTPRRGGTTVRMGGYRGNLRLCAAARSLSLGSRVGVRGTRTHYYQGRPLET